jgi:hypothetical protein
MELDPYERAHLEWSRALSTDNEEREVFVGLSFEKSEELQSLRRTLGLKPAEFEGSREEYDRQTRRYVQLFDKHEAARLQAVGAEHQVSPRQLKRKLKGASRPRRSG